MMSAVPLAEGHCCHILGLSFACFLHLCIYRGRFSEDMKVSIICYIANYFKIYLRLIPFGQHLAVFLNEVSHCGAYWDCTPTLSFNRHYVPVTLASQLCMP